MSNLSLDNIKKIAEYNMREIGLWKNELENGWKDDVTVDKEKYELKSNLKKFRDMIAQIVLDVLTDVVGNGTLSSGNNKGSVGKSGNNDTLKLNKKMEINGAEKEVAFKNGEVSVVIPANTMLVIGPGVKNPNPITLIGQINEGTENIKVGS